VEGRQVHPDLYDEDIVAMAVDVNVYLNRLKNIKLTKEQQQTVVLVVVVIVAAIFGYFKYVLGPLNVDIAKYRKDLDTMKSDIQEAKIINPEEYRQRRDRVQAGNQYVARRLPPADSAMWNLQDLVRISLGDVWLDKFTVDRGSALTQDYEGFRKSVAAVTLATDFHRLGSFLSRLSGEESIYCVEDPQLNEPSDEFKKSQRATVLATLKLVTFATEVKKPGGVMPEVKGDPKDIIKSHKFEIIRTDYHSDDRRDPFESQMPFKRIQKETSVKVRIGSLKLSSVITGKQKVAIFKELHGPSFSYILVNGVLLGPERQPIPGVAGTIEPLNRQGEYRVTLKQGADRIEFSLVNSDLIENTAVRKRQESEKQRINSKNE